MKKRTERWLIVLGVGVAVFVVAWMVIVAVVLLNIEGPTLRYAGPSKMTKSSWCDVTRNINGSRLIEIAQQGVFPDDPKAFLSLYTFIDYFGRTEAPRAIRPDGSELARGVREMIKQPVGSRTPIPETVAAAQRVDRYITASCA